MREISLFLIEEFLLNVQNKEEIIDTAILQPLMKEGARQKWLLKQIDIQLIWSD